MLGDISPQTVKITSQAVVYPGRDHVTTLNVKRFSGRQYSVVDLSALTRAVLVFPQTDPVIAYDTATAPAGTITWAGSDITIDLSGFSMPASVQSSYLIVYDAEHTGGQVLVDDDDSIVEFDFRNVSATGIIQPPVLELVSEAPIDGETYGRKDGAWVTLEAIVAGVSSVDGRTGAVTLGDLYAPLAHVGAGGAAHANVVAAGAAGFMTGVDKTKLDGVATGATANANTDSLSEGATNQYHTEPRVRSTLLTGLSLAVSTAVAATDSILVAIGKLAARLALKEQTLTAGTNVTIDRTDPENPVINASGGGGSGDVVGPASAVNNGVALFDGTTGKLIKDGGALGTAAFSATGDFAAAAHVGAGGTAHADVIAAGAAGFMTGADKTKLDGIATGANLYVHPNHSGDVTSVADGVQTIAANAVTNTKLADVATQTIKGRITAATGDPEDLNAAQVRTLINVADGATANSTDASLRDRTTHTGVQAISTVTDLQTTLDGKQATLVSGTNIKTVNGSTLLGSGNLVVSGAPAVVATFTGNKTLALTDINTYNVSQDGTAQAVTVPAQATVVWTADAEIHIQQGGAGTVTVTGATGVIVNGVSAGSFALAGQFSAVTLKRTGSDAWTLIGVPSFFYDRENILGTVSQSGGVPTGALMEYGTNANGEYWRYAGGMQVCKMASIVDVSGAGDTFNSVRTYPAGFAVAPIVTPAIQAMDTTFTFYAQASANAAGTSTVVIARRYDTAQTYTLAATAVGRWF